MSKDPVLDPTVKRITAELLSEISRDQGYQNALEELTEVKNPTAGLNYTMKAMRLVKAWLIERGVGFHEKSGNTPQDHENFLVANGNIKPENAKYLLPGSLAIYCIQSTLRNTKPHILKK